MAVLEKYVAKELQWVEAILTLKAAASRHSIRRQLLGGFVEIEMKASVSTSGCFEKEAERGSEAEFNREPRRNNRHKSQTTY